MAEWSMAVVLKTTVPGRVPGVRIPLPPPPFARPNCERAVRGPARMPGLRTPQRHEEHDHGFPTRARMPLDPRARRQRPAWRMVHSFGGGAARTRVAGPAPDDVRPGDRQRSVCRERDLRLEGCAVREAAGG